MKIKTTIHLLFLLFVLIGCKPKQENLNVAKEIENLNKFEDYVSEVTHGIISAQSDVRVVLKTPVKSWKKGEELDAHLLRVFPSTKGKVVALDNKTIAFIPEKSFKQNTEYTFQFALSDIVNDISNDLKTMVFRVKTLRQQFNVFTEGLQSYSKSKQYINGQLFAADVLSLENAKQLLVVTQKGKPIQVKFDETLKNSKEFHFKIDSIQRYNEDTVVEIIWNGDKVGIESSGSSSVTIAGKSSFTVLSAVLDKEKDQVVLINFSDPLKKGQNFKGLVVLQGDSNVKYKIEGNTLKVYPSKDLKGNVNLEVLQGVESEEGYKLKTNYQQHIAFEQLKPQVRLLSNGTILPASSNLKINFETVSLNAVDVTVFKIYENNILQFLQSNSINGASNLRSVARPIARKKLVLQNGTTNVHGKWMAHALDLSSLITPELGAVYRVEFNYRSAYSTYVCESTNFDTVAEDQTEDNFDEEQEDSSWDGIENYYDQEGYYGYNWNERDNPCDKSYYYDKKIGLNVLATTIGVTIKSGINKSYFVAVNDILTTKPIEGATVTFYNFQQQLLGQVSTDANGMAIYDADKLAFFAVIENNGQKNYVKLNDGNALSVSKFNVSGTKLDKGIKGFIFGERGVWRPGDDIFLSFMLNDNANKLPEGHPVKLELLDPYNNIVHREISKNGLDNFFRFNIKTDANAPTGNWLAKISVGGASFTKTLKIEAIKPNRLKIKTTFDTDVLSNVVPVRGNMEVKWLHGAIARNLHADITAKFSAAKTQFKTFPSYVFDDPTRSFSVEDQIIFDDKIDNEGKASFNLKPQLNSLAPGMLNTAFITKVYENGGDFSTDVFTKPFSPYATYIGLKAPKGDKNRGMLLTDVKHRFEVVSVDKKGKPKATKNLKVAVYKINWRWWWDTSPDNLSSFSNSEYKEAVFEKTINTDVNGEASFDFELKYPDWGRYLVRVEDPNGSHATGKTIFIDWPGWAGKARKGDPSAATMLVFSTDKETYSVGETATVSFPSSFGSRALVTVENGSEVLESFWVETVEGETKFQLPVSELYTPNVFINIALLQPHANTKNDLPIRMYGVTCISVENKASKLTPVINMPEVLQPEEAITVKVSEKEGKAMTYSIAIVDEGLLDLTRFKTPNPWNTFYAKEALGVKTWDVYDDVIGAFGGKINQIFAIGGDGELAGAKNKKANRFEPMVVYLGPFSLKKGAERSHEIKIPKYIGSVRTMVVASDNENEAYGKAEKTTAVRKPLMILASLPRKITSGEIVTLPVTVFAMDKKVKNVTLKIKRDKAFTIQGGDTQKLTFTKPDEKMAYFQLKVSDFLGSGKVIVEASGSGEKASFEIPIAVVNPNPVSVETTRVVFEPNASQSIDIKSFGIEGSNSVLLEFSTLPSMNFNGRMKYLIQYPHGCLEQITSRAFPQLFLTDVFEMDMDRRKRIQKNINSAIKRLGSLQNSEGGFSYWPGQNLVNDWGTTYVGHFLFEAEKKGYVLPITFKANWVKYQQTVAKQWRSGDNSDLAQAYRLYTLALSGNADVASMNRLRETSGLTSECKFRLAAAYAAIGQAQVAQKILDGANVNDQNSTYYQHTYGSSDRNRAMALETYVLMKSKDKAQALAKVIAENLSKNTYMSTQSTAYSLLAMARFAQLIGGKSIKAEVALNGKLIQINSQKTLVSKSLAVKNSVNSIVVKNKENHVVYLNVLNSGVLAVGQEKSVQKNLYLQTAFKGRDGMSLAIDKLTQGTDFVAEVTLTNATPNELRDVALSEIFPSGWEIVNTRFTDFGDFMQNEVTHTDIRDDRVNFYFDMKPKETKTFSVLLNASYLGKYYLPGVQAEAMYNYDYFVRTAGQWVEVVQ